jgi:hypothetical protein
VRDEYQRFTLDGFHLCGGVGLRFAFAERSIMAIDVGFDGEPISPRRVHHHRAIITEVVMIFG